MMNHIPFRELVDYVEGDLPVNRRVDVEIHVAACNQCLHELTELDRLIGLMRTDRSENAPSRIINRAVSLFYRRGLPSFTPSGLHSRIAAALHFDSLGLAPAFGVRSGKPGARQMLFTTGVNEIDVRIEPAGQDWIVSGQVLGESVAGGRAILQGPAGFSQTSLNELSEFTLPPVQPGAYKLILSLEEVDVEIEDISIGTDDG